MDARSLNWIAAACDGELLAGSPQALVRRVCSDSRLVQPGDLFFALSGERFDGHAFVAEAAAKGAAAAVVARGLSPESVSNCALVRVQDTRQALGRVAARYRQEFSLPVVAVAGSNGKTTTKELLASVLRQKYPTLSSEGSFNNEIGVPLTLLRLESAHRAAVLEAGTNHPGELAPLLKIISPSLGVLTSIGREHLEFFGDLPGVAQEEGWLAETLPAEGTLFINGDCPWAGLIARRARARLVRVGFTKTNEWRAANVRPDKQGVAFRVEGPRAEMTGDFRISLLGRHQVLNALLAIALGGELGLGRAEVSQGLAQCKAPRMRLQAWDYNGISVLDDTYNANADSMLAALETLRELPCKGRRVAVLGDMAELGAHSAAAHEEVGRRVAELGIEQLFAVGKMASVLARGARGAGLNRVLEFADVEGTGLALKQFLKSGDLLLLKASRAARLERIAQMLRGDDPTKRN
ncbi:MAG: UDP-N-acetylmuramoyl-tripeptide--D-alanyl-D-alanine ligase [Limisphaerales bacterium]